MPIPLVAGLGPQEIVLIFLVVVLLFGAKKLPELARGSGRALRIFKAETKGLLDEDEKDDAGPEEKTPLQRALEAKAAADAEVAKAQAQEQAQEQAQADRRAHPTD